MKKSVKITSIILFILSGIVLLYAHHLYGMEGDDFFYSTNLVTGQPLSSFSDIIEGQYWHYFNWGGRIVAHFLLQVTFLCLSATAIDILNVVLTLVLIVLLCKVSGAKGPEMMLITFSFLFGASYLWQTCLFWQSGAANYLYMSLFILLFLFCYLRGFRDDKLLPLAWLWMLPLGLCAGWSNENVGPTLWILSLILIILYYRAHKKIPVWMIVGNISCLIGSALMILAPGNSVRGETSSSYQHSLFGQLFLRCYNEFTGIFQCIFAMTIIAAFIFIIGFCILHIPVGVDRILFLLGFLFSWGAMIASPVFSSRAFFGPFLFLILFTLSYLKDIWSDKKELILPITICMSLFWIHSMYDLIGFILDMRGFFQ